MTEPSAEQAQHVGRLLEKARISAGLSKREAAKRANISEGQWRVMEAGVRQVARGVTVPTTAKPSTYVAAARAVGADVRKVLDAAGLAAVDVGEVSLEMSSDEATRVAIAGIDAHPDLIPEAKSHLIKQLGLLLRVAPGEPPGESAGSSVRQVSPLPTPGTNVGSSRQLPLRRVARKRDPSAPPKGEPVDD